MLPPVNRPVPLLCVLGAIAACGNSNSGADAGAAVLAQPYFNLQPGLCFGYDNLGDKVSIDLVPVQSPAGVALHRAHGGLDQEVDFLTFDGGTVYLAERELVGSAAQVTEVFTPPLPYLTAPLGGPSLNGTSSFTTGTQSGTETLDVSQVGSQPWLGLGADGGFTTETKIDFTFDDGDGGEVVETGLIPGLGFTDLFLPNPSGTFVDYLLTRVYPDDAGCP